MPITAGAPARRHPLPLCADHRGAPPQTLASCIAAPFPASACRSGRPAARKVRAQRRRALQAATPSSWLRVCLKTTEILDRRVRSQRKVRISYLEDVPCRLRPVRQPGGTPLNAEGKPATASSLSAAIKQQMVKLNVRVQQHGGRHQTGACTSAAATTRCCRGGGGGNGGKPSAPTELRAEGCLQATAPALMKVWTQQNVVHP